MNYIADHWEIIGAGLWYLGSAAISTMPPKDCTWTGQTLYGWFFDWTHMLLNSRPTKGGAL